MNRVSVWLIPLAIAGCSSAPETSDLGVELAPDLSVASDLGVTIHPAPDLKYVRDPVDCIAMTPGGTHLRERYCADFADGIYCFTDGTPPEF
jgi:hypothetical protein